MSESLLACLVATAAYLFGAIPFGYLIARSRGVNIFEHGSGNIGATNVGRVLGVWWGILVFLLDFAKGALPVGITMLVAPRDHGNLPPDSLAVLAGICAFLGHLFPIYLGFRGGKGVATGAGVVTVLLPTLAAVVLVVWAIVLGTTRYMSLASVTGAAALLLLRLLWTSEPWAKSQVVLTTFCLVAAILVIARHQSNLRRLLGGTEPRM